MSDDKSGTHQPTPIDQMAHLVGEMTEMAVTGQAIGLEVLAAEMQALTQLMPGLAGGSVTTQTDAEVEASFDNMPV